MAALAERVGQTLGGVLEPLSPAEAAGEHPLSHGQRGLWLLERLGGASGVGNLGGAMRIRGALDAALLREALRDLALRHPALPTTFSKLDGEPRQRVLALLDPGFEILNAAWSEGELRDRIARDIHRPFDLASGPPLRAVLWTRPAGDVLSLAVHHLVPDLWSLTVLVRDLGALYAQRIGGIAGAEELPALELSPLDVFRHQEHRLTSPEGETLWEYWRHRLAGPPPVCDLPTDRPRPRCALSTEPPSRCGSRRSSPAACASWAASEGPPCS